MHVSVLAVKLRKGQAQKFRYEYVSRSKGKWQSLYLLSQLFKIRMFFLLWKCWSSSVAHFSSCCRNVPQIIKNHLSGKAECWPSGRKERSETYTVRRTPVMGVAGWNHFCFWHQEKKASSPGIDCKPVAGKFAGCYGRHVGYMSQQLVSASSPLKR